MRRAYDQLELFTAGNNQGNSFDSLGNSARIVRE